jgi:hypothetical protein
MGNRLSVALLSAVAGGFLVRWLGQRWGATDEEVHEVLPGDEVVAHPMLETTHAITIQTPPSAVWPWLAQAGYRGAGRAGWYTDAAWDPLVERYVLPLLVPAAGRATQGDGRSADYILPDLQHVAVGDIIPDGPPGTAWFTVVEAKPARSLVLYSDSHTRYLTPGRLQGTRWASYGEFSWSFILRPAGRGTTRLILRTRARLGPRPLRAVAPLPLYLADFLYSRQLLLGVRQRAECVGSAGSPRDEGNRTQGAGRAGAERA